MNWIEASAAWSWVAAVAFLLGREVGGGRTVPVGAWAVFALAFVGFFIVFLSHMDGGRR